MRRPYSIPVNKCIYEMLRYPSQNGGFEKYFIESIDRDSEVERFCKIDEYKHSFLRLRYINEEGMPSFYHPDFLVKINDSIYLVETKGQNQIYHLDVKRKHRAAYNWCNRINKLSLSDRMNAEWKYVLIGQSIFNAWMSKGASIKDILDYAAVKGFDVEDSKIFSNY
jgi:type III restriction enzyme